MTVEVEAGALVEVEGAAVDAADAVDVAAFFALTATDLGRNAMLNEE